MMTEDVRSQKEKKKKKEEKKDTKYGILSGPNKVSCSHNNSNLSREKYGALIRNKCLWNGSWFGIYQWI